MKSKIAMFIFISASIHFLALNFYDHEKLIIIKNKHGESLVNIIIQEHNSKQKQISVNDEIISKSAINKPSIQKNTIKSTQETHKKQNKDEIVLSSRRNLNKEPEKKSIATNVSRHKTQNPPDITQIKNILETELSKHFYYPKTAQRRSWQGQVILEFVITPDGNLSQVQINKSSGYEILDKAAIYALRKIEEHEDLALALNGHSIEQILPVTYKLIN